MSKIRALPVALVAVLALGTASVYAQEAEEPVDMAADSIDGTWTLDTSIGDFEDFTGSYVGFRVAEVLNPGGAVDAVGRTPAVSGQLEVTGSVIESASIEADLTGIVSDKSRRDPAIHRALATGEYPTASFVSSGPVDLGAIPTDEAFSASVPGSITIRDVSQDVTLDLAGQRVDDVVLVVGTLPVTFSSFGVTMPTAPIVVSVEDSGFLEWQLFFRLDSGMEEEMTEEEMTEEAASDE